MEDVDYYYDDDELGFNDSDYYHLHTVCNKEAVRSFASVFLPVVYALTLATGLAGNALVVAVYASRVRLRTLTDVCILNLAASDLLLLLTLPFWAADAVHGWHLGAAACKAVSFLYSANFSCGMLLLACVSVDRYRAVARSGGPAGPGPGPRAWKRWLLVMVALWVCVAFLGLPELLFSTVKHSPHGLACTAVYPHGMARPAKAALELLEVTLRFLLPLVVMAWCYGHVGRALGRATWARSRRKWRALRVLLVVVAVFLLTQLPYSAVKLWRAMDIIYGLVTDCGLSKRLDQALQVTEALALSHACVNPLLYALMGSSFRAHVLKLAKRVGRWLGRHGPGEGEGPAPVEMALRSRAQTQSQSGSGDQDTSTFTI
ncbi:atypical chemokine receptor 4b [Nelusetta ayraudi]|uniref:atypical chemokine receptor 4b n=1 Tax=Nelusetta ayraudi TaxID=303726 RepID=UPI003F6E8903